MRVAFIGGTQFIGHAAAEALVARGHDVTLIHRGKHRSEVLGAQEIFADRADPHDLIRALGRARPEVVVETRAMTRPDAETSALALKILGTPAVVLSSLAQEDGGDDDKRDVEDVYFGALADGLPGATILRLPPTYGPRDPERRFGAVVDALDRGERRLPRQGGGRFRRTHADVRDVGHAIALAAERRAEGYVIYDVGERDTPTMSERVEAIAAIMGIAFDWIETGGLSNDLVADTTKIRRELGYAEVTSAEQSLRDLVDWLRQSRARLN